MKVKHLIRELKKCNPDYAVETEGCDCNGDSCFLEIDEKNSEVMIRRSIDDWKGEHRFPDYGNTHPSPKPLP